MPTVMVVWRPNDDIVGELYKEIYHTIPIYSDKSVRVYALRAHYIFVDETNPSGGHLIYVSKEVPLKLAILAVKAVLWEELTLNIDFLEFESEEEKEEYIKSLAEKWDIPNPVRDREIRILHEALGEEGQSVIEVWFPPKYFRRG